MKKKNFLFFLIVPTLHAAVTPPPVPQKKLTPVDHSSLVQSWLKTYNLNDLNLFSQDHLNGMASTILYLINQTPGQGFTELFSSAKKQFTSAPNDFFQALMKCNEHAIEQVNKQKIRVYTNHSQWKVMKFHWVTTLAQYYHAIYEKLDPAHKTISYGPDRKNQLPNPQKFFAGK